MGEQQRSLALAEQIWYHKTVTGAKRSRIAAKTELVGHKSGGGAVMQTKEHPFENEDILIS